MDFEWNELKNRSNEQKHGLSFDTAKLVFDDPLAVTVRDRTSVDEERWKTVGTVEGLLLVVVHTFRQRGKQEIIRMISARRASPREKRSYEREEVL